jgi:hypothetical protein
MPEAAAQSSDHRLEVATAVVLSIAGLASAWASYQAALWGGVQAANYATATARMTEAAQMEVIDGQRTAVETALLMSWLSAAADDDKQLMTFYERRFPPEMRAVFVPWRARYPDHLRESVKDGPPIPLPKTQHEQGRKAGLLRRQAAEAFRIGDSANGNSDRYVASTVVFSTVLFLAGISPQLRRTALRKLLVGLAAALGCAAIGFLLTLPVARL